jgi:hypothetical protein
MCLSAIILRAVLLYDCMTVWNVKQKGMLTKELHLFFARLPHY